ncbi:MAG: cation-translocating P-type ATPase [Bdellovibrionota bacterium]
MVPGAELADVFIFAISLAVAAVPEGLPAVVTIALAFGLTRMSKRNALIRRLPSVETLGSVTVICSDKTGTLTRNEMTVRKIATADQVFEFSGVGYEPIGNLTLEGSESPISGLDKYPGLHEAIMSGIFCNNAKLLNQGTSWIISGDPTEGSLIVAAEKVNLSTTGSTLKAVYQVPFDSDRKMMSSIYEDESQNLKVFTKGALESVLGQCEKALLGDSIVDLTQELRSSIIARSEKMASGALRVLALANRVVPADERRDMELSHQLEAKLTFLGLAGMIDPPREEAKVAVKKCKEAGIKPVMITGDHPGTGLAIARELGIAEPDDKALTGKELDQLSEADLEQKVSQVSVYARVSPAHKHRVVNAWKNQGAIVAMTGDGVNDAPAIKSADIGIAMGITGTDVTKGASAMVLTDDHFATIVNAVEEGRGIFSNIQNITQFLLSANSGEILLILISTLIGWPTPLLPIQILWINLVTDSFPALALATERPEKGVMERPPRRVNEPIFTRERGLRILTHGFLLAFASGFSYWWSLYYNPSTLGNVNHAQAVAFCVCTFSQLAYSFACRSQGRTHLEAGVFSNLSLIAGIGLSLALQLAVILVPAIQPLFLDEPVTLSTTTWGVIIFAALSPVTLIELYKLMRKFFTSKSSAKNVEKSFSSRGVGT